MGKKRKGKPKAAPARGKGRQLVDRSLQKGADTKGPAVVKVKSTGGHFPVPVSICDLDSFPGFYL